MIAKMLLILCLAFSLSLASGCVTGTSDKNVNISSGNTSTSSGDASASGKLVVALFDLSDSTGAQVTRRKYAESFKRVLDKMGAGDRVVGDAITDNPLSQSTFPINDEFAPFAPGTDNPLFVRKKQQEHDEKMQAERAQIETKAQALLSNAPQKVLKTKILDAMLLAERVFHSYNNPKKVLIVFSDMIEESDKYNFQRQKLTGADIERILREEKSANRLPDLTGVHVYVVGAAANGAQAGASEKFINVEKFWLQYFKATGADSSGERYGAALLNFNE